VKAVSLVADAASLEDAMYALDRGLQTQAIPLESFLKQVCARQETAISARPQQNKRHKAAQATKAAPKKGVCR
jgi:hypothetical protein